MQSRTSESACVNRRYRQIAYAVLSGAISKGSNLLANVVIVPVTVRYFGAEAYGLWVTILSTVNAFILLDIGISNTLSNLITECFAADDREKAAEYFSNAFWMVCGVSIALAFSCLLLWPHLDWPAWFNVREPHLGAESSQAVATAIGILLLSFPAGLASRVLAGYQESHIANLFTLAGSGLSLAGVLLAVHLRLGLPAFVAVYAGPLVLANLSSLIWLSFVSKPWIRPRLSLLRRSHIARIFTTGGQFFGIQLAGVVVMNSDNLVLSHYLSPSAVTQYNTTWRLIGYVLALQSLPLTSLWPAMSEAHVKGDLVWVRVAYRRMLLFTGGVLALACVFLVPLGKVTIRIWAGRSAVPSESLLILMCVWMCLCAVTVCQANLMGAVGRVGKQAIASCVAACCNLGLSLWWVRTLGQIGVLLATVVSYVLFIVSVQHRQVASILKGSDSVVPGNLKAQTVKRARRAFIVVVRFSLRNCIRLLRVLPPWGGHLDKEIPPSCRRILLLHPGHLGDIVIATSVLDPLRRRFPNARFGFVVGKTSAIVLEGLEEVEAVHELNHWRLNRTEGSLLRKWIEYYRTRQTVLGEIRKRGYDIAVNLFNHDPDLLDLSWQAGIPVRVGFQHSYFAPLATHTVKEDVRTLDQQALRQAQVLKVLGIPSEERKSVKSKLGPDTDQSVAEVCRILGTSTLREVSYRVLHMGSGFAARQMPEQFWREIAETLSERAVLLFTGQGAREQEVAERVMRDLPSCINACNQLSWRGFLTAIRAADALYGVDSLAGHVAAAVGTPSVLAYAGMMGVSRWRPLSELTTVFSNHLPCAPCLIPSGCAEMACKRISPAELLAVTPSRLGFAPLPE